MKPRYLALLVVLMAVSIVLASMAYNRRIPSTGTVTTVGVEAYWDIACTQNVTVIAWDGIFPSTTKNVTIYIHSTSSKDANLTLITDNWNPNTTSTFVTLTWDYDGTALHPNETRKTVFFLAVSENVTGITDFSFDIIIRAVI
jgi:hypothetical protein